MSENLSKDNSGNVAEAQESRWQSTTEAAAIAAARLSQSELIRPEAELMARKIIESEFRRLGESQSALQRIAELEQESGALRERRDAAEPAVEKKLAEAQESRSWLVEKDAPQPTYLGIALGILCWTVNIEDALRFSRRKDADDMCEIAEDADRVTEHLWLPAAPPEPSERLSLLESSGHSDYGSEPEY